MATAARAITRPRCTEDGGNSRARRACPATRTVEEFATPGASRNLLTSQAATPATTKLSISVVTTSSTPQRARKTPGPKATPAPDSAPASDATTIRTGPGSPAAPAPTTAAARPPATKLPSTPTLKTPVRNASAVANPVNNSGVAELNVAASRSVLPAASRTMSAYTDQGWDPVAHRITAPTARATMNGVIAASAAQT